MKIVTILMTFLLAASAAFAQESSDLFAGKKKTDYTIALDTVVPGFTGIFFAEQSVDSLCEAVGLSDRTAWDKGRLRRHAEGFREEVFRARYLALIDSLMQPSARGAKPAA